MSTTFIIKSGSTHPPIRYTLPSDSPDFGDVANITFVMFNVKTGEEVVNTEGVIEDVPNKVLRYDWYPNDTDERGIYNAHWVLELQGGGTAIYPVEDFIEIQILGTGTESLDDDRIVSPQEVASYMNRTFTEREYTLVSWLIEFLQGQIETYLGRPVTVRTFTDTVYVGLDGAVYFPQTPVQSVEAVYSTDSVPVAITTGFDAKSWGLEVDEYFWVSPLTVTYSAGLDRPAAIRGLVIESVAARLGNLLSDKSNIRRIAVEDFAITYENSETSSSLSIPSTTLESIKRFKKRGFG